MNRRGRAGGLDSEDIELIGWCSQAEVAVGADSIVATIMRKPRRVRREINALIGELRGVDRVPGTKLDPGRRLDILDRLGALIRDRAVADAFSLDRRSWERLYVEGAAARQDAEISELARRLAAMAVANDGLFKATKGVIEALDKDPTITTIEIKRCLAG